MQNQSTSTKASLRRAEGELESVKAQLQEAQLLAIRQSVMLEDQGLQLAATQKRGEGREQQLLAKLEAATKRLGSLRAETVHHAEVPPQLLLALRYVFTMQCSELSLA
jgi:hypothetical protein